MTVKLSPKYQVVIPRALRESAGFKPGQELEMIFFDGHIHILPVLSIKELRGRFKGIGSDPQREKKDRL